MKAARRSDVFRLLDVDAVEKRKGTTKALVPIDKAVCPACGRKTVTSEAYEDALFFHGGYGATRVTRGVQCEDNDCGWYLTAEVGEVCPPRHGRGIRSTDTDRCRRTEPDGTSTTPH